MASSPFSFAADCMSRFILSICARGLADPVRAAAREEAISRAEAGRTLTAPSVEYPPRGVMGGCGTKRGEYGAMGWRSAMPETALRGVMSVAPFAVDMKPAVPSCSGCPGSTSRVPKTLASFER